MRKPLLLGGLNVLVVLVLVNVLAMIASSVSPDSVTRGYQDDRRQVERLLAHADRVTALNLGSSHGLAIDFPTLGIDGYHLWHSSGDVFESVHLAEVFAPRLPRLRLVMISLSLPSLAVDNVVREGGATRRRQMYASLPTWRAIPGDDANLLAGRLQRIAPVDLVVRPDQWRGVFRAIAGRGRPAPPTPRGVDGQRLSAAYTECESLSEAELRLDGQEAVESHQNAMRETDTARPDVQQAAIEALRALVRYLDGRGVQVLLYTPPMSAAYLDAYPRHDATAAREAIASLADEIQVQYIDLADDPRFTNAHELFLNADHLNACGARRFSSVLLDEHLHQQ